jgi:hypothetical protein
MADELINPFIDNIGIQVEPVDNYGGVSLQNLMDLQIGAGAQAFKADSSGIWLGADRFVDARFSVDMNGNLRITNGAQSSLLTAEVIVFYASGLANIIIGDPSAI